MWHRTSPLDLPPPGEAVLVGHNNTQLPQIEIAYFCRVNGEAFWMIKGKEASPIYYDFFTRG